ncbi:hypothetical protein [Albidovulum sediminis]|uniref:Uncharacterized protein n=1 Tax=Albidovulum sediminis TaxID=3066345 RepID=A0ABT2NV26_9RHOB|nr:hypothetical protein [Defluviimonas sediminis]MCT8331799.1 hypothetical protein [Defluviimonas sediminis]
MSGSKRRASECTRCTAFSARRTIPALAAVLWIALSGIAAAHSFTAAILVVGENVEQDLAEAVRGFLLASDERDGHPNETSDGHLGGVDVQVLPLPAEATGLVQELTGSPDEPADVVVVLGLKPAADDAASKYSRASTVLVQALLAEGWNGDDRMEGFIARYRLAYGKEPGLLAASAYHAARRLDIAIRPLDGAGPRDELLEAWQASEVGLPR